MNITENQLAAIFFRHWWVLLLRGVLAVAFGVLTWFRPEISLASLVLFFGVYAFSDGVLGVWMAVSGRKEHEHWWILLLWGIVGIGAGLLAFAAPGITALVLLFYIAVWAISTGVLEIAAAIRLRKEIEGEWWLILCGLTSVVFGCILLVRPGEGALALLWMIAVFSVLFGVLLVLLAFRMRKFAKQNTRVEGALL